MRRWLGGRPCNCFVLSCTPIDRQSPRTSRNQERGRVESVAPDGPVLKNAFRSTSHRIKTVDRNRDRHRHGHGHSSKGLEVRALYAKRDDSRLPSSSRCQIPLNKRLASLHNSMNTSCFLPYDASSQEDTVLFSSSRNFLCRWNIAHKCFIKILQFIFAGAL